MTRIIAVDTALPRLRVSQKEALRFILKNFDLRPGTRAFYRRVFAHESVATRHLAVRKLEDLLITDLDRKNARFEREATRLSAQSLKRVLSLARKTPAQVNFLAVTTCTGYVCPGLAARVVDAAGLRHNVPFADLVGMGCGAALPALQAANSFCLANPGAMAAVVCTEICSAAMVSDDAPDLVISNALFGDGSAAVLLQSGGGKGPALVDTASLVVPAWRDGLRFRSEKGHLRNVLSPEVPTRAARATRTLLRMILDRQGLQKEDIGRWILHPGGARVYEALERELGLSPTDLSAGRAVLKRAGNLSSPAVLFTLAESLKRRAPRPGEWAFMGSFGAGFSAHAALLRFP